MTIHGSQYSFTHHAIGANAETTRKTNSHFETQEVQPCPGPTIMDVVSCYSSLCLSHSFSLG